MPEAVALRLTWSPTYGSVSDHVTFAAALLWSRAASHWSVAVGRCTVGQRRVACVHARSARAERTGYRAGRAGDFFLAGLNSQESTGDAGSLTPRTQGSSLSHVRPGRAARTRRTRMLRGARSASSPHRTSSSPRPSPGARGRCSYVFPAEARALPPETRRSPAAAGVVVPFRQPAPGDYAEAAAATLSGQCWIRLLHS